MKSNKYITVFATGVLLLLASRAGYAIPIAENASFGFVPSGAVTISPGGDVASAVTIFLPATNTVNTLLPTYLGSPNDFCDIPACGFNGGPAGSFLFLGDTVTVPATLDATFWCCRT